MKKGLILIGVLNVATAVFLICLEEWKPFEHIAFSMGPFFLILHNLSIDSRELFTIVAYSMWFFCMCMIGWLAAKIQSRKLSIGMLCFVPIWIMLGFWIYVHASGLGRS